MDYRTQLLKLASRYAEISGLSEARIGTVAVNHGGFFPRIRAGGACSVDVYLRVKQWFADHWPTSEEWPAGVDRPGVLPDAPAEGRAA
ncbi:hypothetical protein [Azospirillum argentinense]|uniref:Uncharacterized protein n=1 Tax=Azospirillum argentinense TaxID=2970906 RepID=A0A5B0KYT7_9PROT|nr:hypothetical protein [Azospirillum argentinense]KAA1057185.1 hypothetical protein FH063_001353 [Azospirillum argentinense]